MRRLVAAAESEAIGYGGVSAVARATGVSRRAITEGIKELNRRGARKAAPAPSRIRRQGAGRKRSIDKDPSLLEDLDRLVDPVTPRRSGIAFALDVQERAPFGGRTPPGR